MQLLTCFFLFRFMDRLLVGIAFSLVALAFFLYIPLGFGSLKVTGKPSFKAATNMLYFGNFIFLNHYFKHTYTFFVFVFFLKIKNMKLSKYNLAYNTRDQLQSLAIKAGANFFFLGTWKFVCEMKVQARRNDFDIGRAASEMFLRPRTLGRWKTPLFYKLHNLNDKHIYMMMFWCLTDDDHYLQFRELLGVYSPPNPTGLK